MEPVSAAVTHYTCTTEILTFILSDYLPLWLRYIVIFSQPSPCVCRSGLCTGTIQSLPTHCSWSHSNLNHSSASLAAETTYLNTAITDIWSQKLCGLRHEMSALVRILRSWVRIPLEACVSVCVYSVFALGSSLCDGLIPQPRSHTNCRRLRNWC